MAVGVIRDHHNLRRNLNLNDNYISNDGGDEGIRVTDAGLVGIGTPVAPLSSLEVFNSNVQYSTGTAYQTSTNIIGSGTTFTSAMLGGRFIFDDGTDAGIVTGFAASNIIIVSISQTVGAADDLRSYKIYYPSVQIDTSGSSSSLKIGNMTIDNDEIDLGVTGGVTIDAGDDIVLSADGGNITMNDGTNAIFDFDVDDPKFKIMDDADSGDYFSISVAANGQTTCSTVDNSGASANLTLAADGDLIFKTSSTGTHRFQPEHRTTSGTADTVLYIQETLNAGSGEAGGSDAHYGIFYQQAHTDIGGWNSIYLMYLIGGSLNPFTVSKEAKVTAGFELKLVYDADSYSTFSVADNSHLSITAAESGNVQLYGNSIVFGTNAGGNHTGFSIKSSGSMWSAAGGEAYIDAAGDISLDASTGIFNFKDAGDDDDAFKITVVGGTGATTLETISDAADGHLSIVADGHVEFDGCGVGFDRIDGVYDATNSTVDFRTGNKAYLNCTGFGITNLKLTFPATSGNFVLLINHPHLGCNITNYLAYDSGGSAASGDANVKWSGNTAPTLTNDQNHVDILSFFWDADTETAYGVATLDFQN